jgi:isopenicillin-N epimerase
VTLDMDDMRWQAARAGMMYDPEVANLNTGSFGPTSRPVFERVTELRRRLAEEPMDFIVRSQPELLWNAREHLARFLGGDSQRLVFTANVTAAINLVACSMSVVAPGEILLTDHEYGAMHWCWERAAQRLGLKLRTFALPIMPNDPAEIVTAFADAITAETRLLFFSHVLSPTGLVLPAREICALARSRGIVTVVDGAHAPAMIPLGVEAIGADYYGANCHKWLLAPIGSGFLYLGAGNEDRLAPLQVSWGWRRDFTKLNTRNELGSTHRIAFLEHEGTRDICPWLVVPEAIAFQEALGWDSIRHRVRELASSVRGQLGEINSLKLVTPAAQELSGAMTAYRLPAGVDLPALRRGLWDPHRIEIGLSERREGNLLRISTHFYNTAEEIGKLARVLPGVMAAVIGS